MTVVMDKGLLKKLDQVKKREWWPVARLAEVLGRPKKYVYRKIDEGKFSVLNDGGYTKVISDTVARYYEKE